MKIIQRAILFTLALLAGMFVLATSHRSGGEEMSMEAPPQVRLVKAAVATPADLVSRAKFPGVDGRGIDVLAAMNRQVNHLIAYQDDKSHYGYDEYFQMYPPDFRGDCEDYAITKLGFLSQMGANTVTSVKLRAVTVHTKDEGDVGHVVLEVLLKNGQVAVLDNRFDELMTRTELIAQGYEFFSW